jgi:hypothetical protein
MVVLTDKDKVDISDMPVLIIVLPGTNIIDNEPYRLVQLVQEQNDIAASDAVFDDKQDTFYTVRMVKRTAVLHEKPGEHLIVIVVTANNFSIGVTIGHLRPSCSKPEFESKSSKCCLST